MYLAESGQISNRTLRNFVFVSVDIFRLYLASFKTTEHRIIVMMMMMMMMMIIIIIITAADRFSGRLVCFKAAGHQNIFIVSAEKVY
jgi:hypothetical protein